MAIIDLDWTGDELIPPESRSFAGWSIFDNVLEMNHNTNHLSTIPILYSSRFGKKETIGIRAAAKDILPVVKNYDKASSEALTATVKFVETYIIRPESKMSNSQTRNSNHSFDTDKITILFIAADPTNASRWRIGEELREIRLKLKMASKHDIFSLTNRMSVLKISVRPFRIRFRKLFISPGMVMQKDCGIPEHLTPTLISKTANN